MKKYDSHNHTNHSLDSAQMPDELCLSAIEKGVAGLTVSDHADIYTFVEDYSYDRIVASVAETEKMRKKYAGRLEILKGVELGDIFTNREAAEKVKSITDFDVILGSVHFVPYDGIDIYCSEVSFDKKSFSAERLNGYINEYFRLIRNMIDTDDIDVVCHLTYIARYMHRKYGRDIDITLYYPQIEDILREIIRKNLALEVNVSGFDGEYDKDYSFAPGEDILKMYLSLGGKKITLGSDSHSSDRVAKRFDEAACVLRRLGFNHYYYFKNRKAVEVPLD